MINKLLSTQQAASIYRMDILDKDTVHFLLCRKRHRVPSKTYFYNILLNSFFSLWLIMDNYEK